MTVVAASAMAAIAAWLLMTPPAAARLHAITPARAARRKPRGIARLLREITSKRGGGRSTNTRHVVQVADLLSSLMAAGLDVTTCVTIVAEAVPQPARASLAAVARALHMGAPPEAAWQSVMRDESWQPIATAMARSAPPNCSTIFLAASRSSGLFRLEPPLTLIEAEPASIGSIYTGYAMILAAIPPLATLIGGQVFGHGLFGTEGDNRHAEAESDHASKTGILDGLHEVESLG
jgi:hypothetical protein